MNNIVIGCYDGYNSVKTNNGGLFIFLKSLRKYNTQCKIIILCNKYKIYKELIECCKLFNATLYEFDLSKYNHYKCYKTYPEIIQIRYLIIKDILCNENNITKILLSDTNDVIFQGDPFSIDFESDFYCALEQNLICDFNNSSSDCNRKWLYDYYKNLTDDEFLNKFKNKYVICAGTILAKYDALMNYLIWFEKNTQINDQGLLNIYIYDFCNSKTLLKYNDSKILTLDKINYNLINKDDNTLLLNNQNEKYIILHQINRCGIENLNLMIKNIFK